MWMRTMPTVTLTAQDMIDMFDDYGDDKDVIEITSIEHQGMNLYFYGANDDDEDANLAQSERMNVTMVLLESPTVAGPCR